MGDLWKIVSVAKSNVLYDDAGMGTLCLSAVQMQDQLIAVNSMHMHHTPIVVKIRRL